MAIPFDDETLAAKIRDVLKKKGVSMRQLSKSLDIPYRTVQNYLGGENRIPAIFFLKLCHYLHIEADFFIYNDFKPFHGDFYDAVAEVLTDQGYLPRVEIAVDPQWQEQHTARVTAIARAAIEISARYDQIRREAALKRGIVGARRFGSREVGK